MIAEAPPIELLTDRERKRMLKLASEIRRRANLLPLRPLLHEWQARIRAEAERWNVLACGRRWGKSTAAEDLQAETILTRRPVAYFAPTYKMLIEEWRKMRALLEPITTRANDAEHRIETHGNGTLEMWSLTDANMARGRKYARVIVDEAALDAGLISAWQSVIRPTLTDYAGDAFFLSTPQGEENDFAVMFKQGQPGDERVPGWKSWQRPAHDNPHIPRAELDKLADELPPAVYDQEVLALFTNAANVGRFLETMAWWDSAPQDVPPLTRADLLIVALDAATSSDTFGMVAVSRHPARPDDLAVRYVRKWEARGGQIDFAPIEQECRDLFNLATVVCFTYDPYQLHHLANRMRDEGLGWWREFSQQSERLIADKQLLDLIRAYRIAHLDEPDLRAHLDHADRKTGDTVDKLRIVKRTPSKKVDLCICLSMGAHVCLQLSL